MGREGDREKARVTGQEEREREREREREEVRMEIWLNGPLGPNAALMTDASVALR